jgi:hypothetical protein
MLLIWFGVPLLIGLFIKRAADAWAPQLTLSKEGALFCRRKELVFCPWEVFDTRGAQVRIGQDKAIVPVVPLALPLVTIERNGVMVAEDNLKTLSVSIKPGNEVVLRGPYVADIGEVAGLLLHLAWHLRDDGENHLSGLASGSSSQAACPAAWPGKRGWVHVRLSRFCPPPMCCGCDTIPAASHPISISSESGTEPVILHLPLCQACNLAGKRRRRKKLALAVANAVLVLPCLLILLVILLTAGVPVAVILSVGLIAIVAAATSTVWLFSSARSSRLPFEASRYSPRDGTAKLRFRRREYADALLAAANGTPFVHDLT